MTQTEYYKNDFNDESKTLGRNGRMIPYKSLSVLSLLAFLHLCQALLEPISLPMKLHECYELKSLGLNTSQIDAKEIQDYCVKNYLYSIAGSLWAPKLSQEAWNYINSLFRKLNQEIEAHKAQKAGGRKRRQVQTWRYRQEIRALTEQQWQRLTDALNRLKYRRIDAKGTSAYDAISILHSGPVVRTAHGGANFPGWHRMYLLVLETAVGVPIPYWDSSLDHEMDDPTKSPLWTEEYFGNGDGDVKKGPFKEWRTIQDTPIIRNIGARGSSLIRKQDVGLVLSRSRLGEIVEPQNGPAGRYSLERHHNGPHRWVGGHLASLNAAAGDPVFFFHHAFIDYIYANFRDVQRRRGVDPATDYPLNTPPGHRRLDITNFQPYFREMYNNEALSNYIENSVTYEPAPDCYNFCSFSRKLRCDRSKRVCIPLPSPAMQAFALTEGMLGDIPASTGIHTDSRLSAMARGSLPLGERFPSAVFVDERAQNPVLPFAPTVEPAPFVGNFMERAMKGFRRKRSINLQEAAILHANTNVSQTGKPVASDISRSFQNDFTLDGVSDVKRWVFVPVRIFHERPPGLHFNAHLYFNGHGVENTDLYEPWHNKDYNNSVNIKKLAGLPRCKVLGSGASKVYVTTEGLDYSGQYTDYAIVDGREAKSLVVTYVGIKNPSLGAGRVLFTAFDSCEHSCRPTCLVPNSNPPVYQPCSGAFQITSSEPKMYSLTREDAINSVFNINSGSSNKSAAPPITFICDSKAILPWETANL